jgi:hypothetical protein
MVLTIFRKDLRLLWPGVIAVALLQVALAAFEYAKGPFGDGGNPLGLARLTEAERLLEAAVLTGVALLISLAVHQDAVPQVDLDWMVRPIRRRQLALAKLAFFAASIHLPMLIVDFAECLATGFDPGHSLAAALSRNLFFLAAFTLPLFSIAALTRNTLEFIVGAGVLAAAIEILDRLFAYFFGITLLRSVFLDYFAESNWIIVFLKYSVIVLGSAAVLFIQYSRRKTAPLRVLFFAIILAGFAVSYLPWQAVFAIQETISGGRDFPALTLDAAKLRARILKRGSASRMVVSIPIAVSDVPPNASLVLEWEEAAPVLIGGHPRETGSYTDIVSEGTGGPWLHRGSRGSAYVGFYVPGISEEQLKDLPAADLAIDLAVTLIEALGPESEFKVSEDYFPLPLLGRCRVRGPARSATGTPPLVADCAQAGPPPAVTSMAAYAPGQDKPYAIGMSRFGSFPFNAQLVPDALDRFSVGMMPATDRPTADFYPDSRVVMRNYRTIGHRKLHLTLSGLVLRDHIVDDGEE